MSVKELSFVTSYRMIQKALYFFLASWAVVSGQTRIANNTITLPIEPPASEIIFEEAFPNVNFGEVSFVAVRAPSLENNRLFLVEKQGRIRVVTTLDSPNSSDVETFLDLPNLLSDRSNETFDDQLELGLLSMAFHPDYSNNGYFYVMYDLMVSGERFQRLSRFTVSANDPNLADSTSEQVLIQVENNTTVHNGGDLHFGLDGYLYASWGDEEYVSLNGQSITEDFWSSVTRIDVDKKEGNIEPNEHPAILTDGSGNAHYSVPADNPAFTNGTSTMQNVRTEFWAIGLRNPWRMAIDPLTGKVYLGDVGDVFREEVNEIVSGGNYGWPLFEGTVSRPDNVTAPTGWKTLSPPIFEYPRSQGISIIGGVVYRGGSITSLEGHYIFSDWISGNVWALDVDQPGAPPSVVASRGGIVAFGYHPATNDILIVGGNSVQIMKASDVGGDFPVLLSETGVFADLADLTPNQGVVAYDINVPFWSDYAEKQRWFVIPDTTDTVTYRENQPWTFPTGSIWIKHFDIELTRGDPATSKRLETRVIVKNDDGMYGVSYRWNEAGTDASLVDASGTSFDLTVIEDSVARRQTWQIPSRSNCITCHTPNAGYALSFNTRQLNRSGQIGAVSGNFISLLSQAGYLDSQPAPTQVLPKHAAWEEPNTSLHEQVRSYLAVNCAYCHEDGGVAEGDFSMAAHLGLSDLNLINGVLSRAEDPADRLIVPGNTNRSAILSRIAASQGYTRMPPIGSNEIDHDSVQHLTAWINTVLINRQTYDQWVNAELSGVALEDTLRSADPDGDGIDNHSEFLLGTSPRMGANNTPSVEVSVDDVSGVSVTLPHLEGRSIRVENSEDLQNWSLWPVNGNDGREGARMLFGPNESPQGFFRFEIREN